MEQGIKKRAALVGVLLVTGLMLTIIGSACGADDLILTEGSSDGVHLENKEVQQPSMPTDEELLEIIEKDERVQELIAGKDYEILSRAIFTTEEGETIVILLLVVEGNYYEITIDLDNETVTSIREPFDAMILERAEDETPDEITWEKAEDAEDFDEILEKVED